jgi:hypothetical protein
MPPGVEIPAATLVNPHKSERCKEMGKAIRASVLVLLLTCSVRAGWIQNGSPTPPPQPANAVQEPTADGWIQNETADSLTQIALDLLAVLPSLY